jgi:hypothetical protein
MQKLLWRPKHGNHPGLPAPETTGASQVLAVKVLQARVPQADEVVMTTKHGLLYSCEE